ncbi:MAG: cytochrome c4, partial [Thiotrichales bacterium]|nr:cytochrome c4 [Thiotrichales bacterium]
MLNIKKVLLVSIVVMGASQIAVAGDAAAGKEKASTCVACHGADGISPNDLWPNLAGQKAGYLVKQMKA